MKMNSVTRGRDILRMAAGLLAILILTAPVVQGAVETKNLLQNGDFEETGTPPPGWTIQTPGGTTCDVVSGAVSGKQALKISIPVPGNVVLTSEPVPVSAGEDYLLTFWYQAEGMDEKGDGCDVDFFLIWVDGVGRQFKRDACMIRRGQVPDYLPGTFTLSAPSNASGVRVQGTFNVSENYTGSAIVIHVDQVRLMKLSKLSIPADAVKWEVLQRHDYAGLQIVEDKDASEGKAVLAEFGKVNQWIGLTWGALTPRRPPGEYLATFWLKVGDNTKNEPVAVIDASSQGTLNNGLTRKYILATDFKQAGVYQDFSIRFVRPEEGALEVRVLYQGATDLWYDKKTLTQLHVFATDREQSAVWLGGTGGITAVAGKKPASGQNKVLLLKGLTHQVFLESCLKGSGFTIEDAYLARLNTGFFLDKPFPSNLEALEEFKVVVLADIPASALGGFMNRRTLKQFVNNGGSLLVFGGGFSYGKGGVAGSAFEDVLPVTITGPWDIVRATSPVVEAAKVNSITKDLDWSRKPVIHYYHKTTPKPNTEVILECDGAPVLVAGKFGKGKVIAFTGTNFGVAAEKETPFYDWPDYEILLSRVMQWLVKD